jgi:hypothetical protein
MDKIVVVNDCAHVLWDMLPFLRDDFDVQYVPRGRGWVDKTFGVLNKIRKLKGDLFHVNYALQDAWLIQKLKGLDVLHAHGSDVRWAMNSFKWGWMVKSNLRNAGKVLYSTPDLAEHVDKVRGDAEYFPTPVRTDLFTAKTWYDYPVNALYFHKKYEEFPVKLSMLLREYDISLTLHDCSIPYCDMPCYLKGFDVFVDQHTIPAFSKTCLEAMSSGLATVDYRHLLNVPERIKYLSSLDHVVAEGCVNQGYVCEYHAVEKRAERLREVWNGILD